MAGNVPVTVPVMCPLPSAIVVQHDGQAHAVRPAVDADLERLRGWRNAHAEAFYDSRPIDAEAQRAWWAHFRADPRQQLYVLEDAGGPVACVGLRVVDGTPFVPRRLELFNLIGGERRARGTGLMAAFYAGLARELAAAGVETVRAEVRRDNPSALRWYLRQGFVETETRPECHVLVHALRPRP
jgi:ribosomal protein S18 acetylase RimI-like enzyme